MSKVDIKPYVTEWYELQAQLKQVKEDEMELRKFIFTALFPDPQVGVNTYGLGDGYFLKATHKLNRKIDIAALQSGKDTFESEDIDIEKLIKYTPDLSMIEYNKLDEEQKKIFDFCLVTTPATPSLEIVKGKKE